MIERIVLQKEETRINHAHGEMRDVINDKRENDQTAHHHVARGERRFRVISVDVMLRTRAPIFDCEQDREKNVKDHDDEQKNTHDPKKRTELAQMFGVTVDPGRPEEDLQISEQMTDDEENQNDASERDDEFLADRRRIKSGDHFRG